MASKLFRAVVGFGISLGATSAACFGATEDGGVIGGDAGPGPSPSSSSTSRRPQPNPPDEDPPPDEQGDAGPIVVKDAGLDAPKDVAADAFCDNAWPTTKGNPGPPKCVDPNDECADAGPMARCYALGDAGTCDFWPAYAPWCVSGEWQCKGGQMHEEDCPK